VAEIFEFSFGDGFCGVGADDCAVSDSVLFQEEEKQPSAFQRVSGEGAGRGGSAGYS